MTEFDSQTAEPDKPLTETQQLLMAYVDDEMHPSQRVEFEKRLGEDTELAAQAAEFQELMDMTRDMAVVEPTEHEMRRFWAKLYNRAEWQMGWILLLVGLATLLIEGIYLLVFSQIEWYIKGAVVSALLGGAILVWNTVRLKIRTSRFDRYRGVMR